MQDKELTAYCNAVKKQLHCSKTLKRKILHALKSSLIEYLEEYPEAAFEDIVRRFGAPEEFAKESLEDLDKEELFQEVQKSRRIKRTILLIAIVICLVIAVAAVWFVLEDSQTAVSYYTEEIIEY